MSEDFRDRIGTVDETGRRKWLFPKQPNGPLYRYRTWVSYFLLAVLFAGPWIRIDSQPLFLFNIVDRKFVLFGQVFWTNDFYLFGLIMIAMVVFLILFTTIYGRVFCGWICPQTIFMEMVYRKIEFWIDGHYAAQKKLRQQPWTGKKIFKRVFKYGLFYLIALGISNTFLAYIIGSEKLLEIQTDPIEEHLSGFLSILMFSGVFFFVYAWFREQICMIVCPYGRLQGVMLDQNSLVVNYDFVRGEGKDGRARLKGGENRWQAVEQEGKGSCVDCGQCVKVCPTGIDIRNGTQMECINCTACIDACNHMMDKTGQPQGLIRIDSRTAIVDRVKNFFTFRSKAYSGVLILLLGLIITLFNLRGELEATILRASGMTYQEQGNEIINLYHVRVLNKSAHDFDLQFQLVNTPGTVEMVGAPTVSVNQGEESSGVFMVTIPKQKLLGHSFPITIGLYQDGKLVRDYKTTFLGPQ